jgi:hypothetical protein
MSRPFSYNDASGALNVNVLNVNTQLNIDGPIVSRKQPLSFPSPVVFGSTVSITGSVITTGSLCAPYIGKPINPVLVLEKSLGNGNDGESIAFNPDDGLLYHISGYAGGAIFETVDPVTCVVGPNLIPGGAFPGALDELEATGLVWYQPIGKFLVAAFSELYTLDADGSASAFLGSTGGPDMRGLTVVNNRLYSGAKDDSSLHEIDPTNGAVLSTVQIELPDTTVVPGLKALATHPMSCLSYTAYKNPANPGGAAHFGSIDLDTGVITFIISLSDKFSGSTFDANGKLWLVSGDGAFVSETLYSISGLYNQIVWKQPIDIDSQDVFNMGRVTIPGMQGPYMSDINAAAAGVKPGGLYYDIIIGRQQVFRLPVD